MEVKSATCELPPIPSKGIWTLMGVDHGPTSTSTRCEGFAGLLTFCRAAFGEDTSEKIGWRRDMEQPTQLRGYGAAGDSCAVFSARQTFQPTISGMIAPSSIFWSNRGSEQRMLHSPNEPCRRRGFSY